VPTAHLLRPLRFQANVAFPTPMRYHFAMNRIQLVTLRGSIAITYRECGGETIARALQFDLVGIGATREKAFRELQDIFADYAEAVLEAKGNVRFFNPSPAEEWENPDKQFYNVTFGLVRKQRRDEIPALCEDIHKLRSVRKDVDSIALQPCLC